MRVIRDATYFLVVLFLGIGCVTRSTMEQRPLDSGMQVKLGTADPAVVRKAARDAIQRSECHFVEERQIDANTSFVLGKSKVRICTTIMPSMGVWARVVVKKTDAGTTAFVLSEKFDPRDAFATTTFIQSNVMKYLQDDVEEAALDKPVPAATPAASPH